jgi:hypothetical protein
MSIFRIGLLVAVVIAVLPEDQEQQARLYDRAANAVHWTTTFCDRNAATCTHAGNVWSAFVRKARLGAQMAYELATKQSQSSPGGASGDEGRVTPAYERPPLGTLTPDDLQPAWRGSGADI